jgi:hypothetical protein
MSTGFKPIEIPPGVVATATKKQRSSNWAEVNLVRWRESQLQPMGGQAKLSNIVGGTEMYQFASRCKLIHGWFGLDGVYRIAYLCELHLYVDVGGTLYDISPTVPIAPPTGLVGGFGDGVYSRNILLTAAAGWIAGATTIQMPAGPGAVLPGMQVYDMTKAAAEGDKTVIVGVVASYSGTTLTLTSGALIAGSAGDVLDFDWYGKQRVIPTSVAITKVPDAYSLDNFGSILYAMTSGDNRLLRWDPVNGAPGNQANIKTTAAFTSGTSTTINMASNPGIAAAGMSVYDTTTKLPVGIVSTWSTVSPFTLTLTAPAASTGASGDTLAFGNIASVQLADAGRGPVPNGRCFVVTQERFIQVFGTAQDGTVEGGKPSRFAWCDQENPGAWDYTNVVSQAGFFDIEPASPIVVANSSRTGTLIWTAKKAYSSRFLGAPYIYNCVELADGTTPWSPQSVATTSSMILWMTEQGPYSYDGTNILPVKCMVRPWVDDDFDPIAVRQLSFAMHLSEFSEWWWFFPTLNSPFNTKAIVYNYNEGWWTQVRLSRSAGMTSSYTSHPIMADDYFAIQHEIFQATSYVNISMPATLPFAETFDLNLGDKLMSVKQLIPDVEAMDPVDANAAIQAISNLRYSLFYRNSRSLGTPELQSVPQSVRPDGYVDLRTTGRDIRLRIDMGSSTVLPFTLGQHLIDAVARGDR